MKLLVTLSTLLALTSAENWPCEDCHAVVSTLATYLTSEESLANQIDILLAEVCPDAEDPEGCVAGLPEFCAMILWPGYWDPEAAWMCATEDICPSQSRGMTCQECFDGIKAGIEQLLLPSTITGIVEALSGDVFCGATETPEECANIIAALIPVALPALAGSGGSEENLTAICNMAVPDTCTVL